MSQDEVVAKIAPVKLRGIRRLVYWCGRGLQVLGLVLIWWVLLLFTGFADMWTLLFWTMIAAVVFYIGWVCTLWSKPSRRASDVTNVI